MKRKTKQQSYMYNKFFTHSNFALINHRTPINKNVYESSSAVIVFF